MMDYPLGFHFLRFSALRVCLLKVLEQNTILELAAKGWTRRRIARELNFDRKTVRRYLEGGSKSPTISTPGSSGPTESKSPISTPGEPTGADLVTAALEAGKGSSPYIVIALEKGRRFVGAVRDFVVSPSHALGANGRGE
jgi:hypothetical protein